MWGVALAAGLLGHGGTALAQQYMPSPVGAARMPEPIPCGTGPTPNLIPGPLSPMGAPAGPPDCLSLSASTANAFPCEKFPPDEHIYFHVGAQGLVRADHLGKGALAVLDPQNLDTGVTPPVGSPVLQRWKDINQDLNWGARATIGYLCDDSQSIELTGFYIASSHTSLNTAIPGQIDVFFNNGPVGFEGDNGLWLQADKLNTTFTQRIFGAELNYRWTNKAIMQAEVILGVRYIDQRENLNIFTDDDGTVLQLAGLPQDPTRQALYFIECQNRIIAPQIGIEYGKQFTPWVTLGFTGKAALGVNLIETQTKLQRGDGFLGFSTNRNSYSFGQVYDVGVVLDFNILERMRLRFGYNAMWLVGVANAVDNLDFNLANPIGTRSDRGSQFYHGPMVEFQFLF
jgi:hypothetical protein